LLLGLSTCTCAPVGISIELLLTGAYATSSSLTWSTEQFTIVTLTCVPPCAAAAESSFKNPLIVAGREHGWRPAPSLEDSPSLEYCGAEAEVEPAPGAEAEAGAEAEPAPEAVELFAAGATAAADEEPADPQAPASITTAEPSKTAAQRRRFITDSRANALNRIGDVSGSPRIPPPPSRRCYQPVHRGPGDR
jgi:hypothetical protein